MEKNLMVKNQENKIIGFDYSQIKNAKIEQIMKQAEEKMEIATQNVKFVMGEQLSKVQDTLAGNNQYDGYFTKWFLSLGLKKDTVYNCINYYQVIVDNSDNQKKLEKVSFTKVCEVAKLKDNNELQKEVIEKAPLEEMKVKQVEELVKEVNEKQEVTDELIAEICNKTNDNNTKLNKFIKTTTSFIEDLREQKEEMTKANFEEVIKLVEEVKELCSKVTTNGGNE